MQSTPTSPSVSAQRSRLGKGLYRKILKELRATRNYDHHLRDIRFLLWVPGTKGKKQYDELKRVAVMSASLHPPKKVIFGPQPAPTSSTKQQQNIADFIKNGNNVSTTTTEQFDSNNTNINNTSNKSSNSNNNKKVINVSPSIADQIRAVARGLFRKERETMDELTQQLSLPPPDPPSSENSSTSDLSPEKKKESLLASIKKVKAARAQQDKIVKDGTKRAFWAIKRLQDIRGGLVPNASMWLVQGGGTNTHYQNYLTKTGPNQQIGGSESGEQQPLSNPVYASLMSNSNSNSGGGGSNSNKSSSSSSSSKSSSSILKPSIPTFFDPFTVPQDAQMRKGMNFPFLHEFLGIDGIKHRSSINNSNTNNNKKKSVTGETPQSSTTTESTEQQQQQQQATDEDELLDSHLDRLKTHGKSKNKVLKLELVSRCASKEGPSARYHLSFRLENISEFAVDVKLAHLFAIKPKPSPILDEMVCLLPLFGNSILSPYSSSAFENSNDDDDEDGNNSGSSNVLLNSGNSEEETEDEDDGVLVVKDETNTENLKSVRRNRGVTNSNSEDDDAVEDEDENNTNEDGSLDEEVSKAPHHQFSRKVRDHHQSNVIKGSSTSSSQEQDNALQLAKKRKSTASLPHISHSKSTVSPEFTAKAKSPDHCSVYDVTFPVEGECVLRGFLLYRTISNVFPAVGGGGGAAEDKSSSKKKMPSAVKSRLKVLHLPVVKLVPPSS